MTVALATLPSTLDWNQSHEQSAQNYPVLLAMMRGLTRLGANHVVGPDLAESWTVETLASGEQRYTFQLVQGLTWSDGVTPFRAQDFVFGWRRAALGADGAELLDVVGAEALRAAPSDEAARAGFGVKALGEHTLEVTLRGARSYFLSRLANVYPYFPAPSAVLEGLDEAAVQRFFNEPKPGQPLVLGAFRPTRWDRVGQTLSLERNPHHVGEGGVEHLEIRQGDLGALLYETCAVDFLFVDEPVQLLKPPADLQGSALLSTYWLGFNTTTVPRELRLALAHAIDSEALVASLRGLVKGSRPARSFLPPELPGALSRDDARLAALPFHDAALARRELDALSPVRELTLLVRGSGSFLPEATLAEGLRRQLAPLGVRLRVVTTSNFSQDVKEADGTLRFDLFLKRTGADYAHPHSLLTPFQSHGNHYTDWQKLEGGDLVRRFEAKLAEGAAAEDPALRASRYFEAEQVLLSDAVAAVPLFHPSRFFRTRAYLGGLTVDPFNFLSLRALRVEK